MSLFDDIDSLGMLTGGNKKDYKYSQKDYLDEQKALEEIKKLQMELGEDQGGLGEWDDNSRKNQNVFTKNFQGNQNDDFFENRTLKQNQGSFGNLNSQGGSRGGSFSPDKGQGKFSYNQDGKVGLEDLGGIEVIQTKNSRRKNFQNGSGKNSEDEKSNQNPFQNQNNFLGGQKQVQATQQGFYSQKEDSEPPSEIEQYIPSGSRRQSSRKIERNQSQNPSQPQSTQKGNIGGRPPIGEQGQVQNSNSRERGQFKQEDTQQTLFGESIGIQRNRPNRGISENASGEKDDKQNNQQNTNKFQNKFNEYDKQNEINQNKNVSIDLDKYVSLEKHQKIIEEKEKEAKEAQEKIKILVQENEDQYKKQKRENEKKENEFQIQIKEIQKKQEEYLKSVVENHQKQIDFERMQREEVVKEMHEIVKREKERVRVFYETDLKHKEEMFRSDLENQRRQFQIENQSLQKQLEQQANLSLLAEEMKLNSQKLLVMQERLKLEEGGGLNDRSMIQGQRESRFREQEERLIYLEERQRIESERLERLRESLDQREKDLGLESQREKRVLREEYERLKEFQEMLRVQENSSQREMVNMRSQLEGEWKKLDQIKQQMKEEFEKKYHEYSIEVQLWEDRKKQWEEKNQQVEQYLQNQIQEINNIRGKLMEQEMQAVRQTKFLEMKKNDILQTEQETQMRFHQIEFERNKLAQESIKLREVVHNLQKKEDPSTNKEIEEIKKNLEIKEIEIKKKEKEVQNEIQKIEKQKKLVAENAKDYTSLRLSFIKSLAEEQKSQMRQFSYQTNQQFYSNHTPKINNTSNQNYSQTNLKQEIYQQNTQSNKIKEINQNNNQNNKQYFQYDTFMEDLKKFENQYQNQKNQFQSTLRIK